MATTAVLGLQWGDEGKGKIVDLLTQDADLVVRYQGGANAGHTVIVGDEKFVLHLVPSGIHRDGVLCLVGNGVVVDPLGLLDEISGLIERGIAVSERDLLISDRAHLVFDYHRRLDGLRERMAGDGKIGTTGRGIGPAYADKATRVGIRAGDLRDLAAAHDKIAANLAVANEALIAAGEEAIDPVQFFAKLEPAAARLGPHVADTTTILRRAIDDGRDVLFEGAQGSLLDLDLGTYPYVTSSTTTIGGIGPGTGISPREIDVCVGVVKAYTTRVGEGPFPTEDLGRLGEELRDRGGEYGATTGRPRRCGWLDAVAARHTARANGVDSLAITKLDVLDACETVAICTAYRIDGREVTDFPASVEALSRAEPVFEEMAGWKAATCDARGIGDLPGAARAYVARMEELLGAPARLISVGQERESAVVT